jgi:hypothetical protein
MLPLTMWHIFVGDLSFNKRAKYADDAQAVKRADLD